MAVSEETRINFDDFVKNLSEQDVVLPDFQRKFEWGDEDKQKALIASVFARLPVGSMLLLNAKSDVFMAREVGCNHEMKISPEKNISYLLDGQQRVTVLTNVFSNIIFEKAKSEEDLLSDELLYRYFLKIPKWLPLYENRIDSDLFGIYTFDFKYGRTKSYTPDFLTESIIGNIERRNITIDTESCIGKIDYKIINDPAKVSELIAVETDIKKYVKTSDDDYYYLPLYLLINVSADKGYSDWSKNFISEIIKDISEDVADNIKKMHPRLTPSKREELEKAIFYSSPREYAKIKAGAKTFDDLIDQKADDWKMEFYNYLNHCLEDLQFAKIVFDASDRDRAIDVFMNLNVGGVQLNTFDLIVAKATMKGDGYRNRIIAYMRKLAVYPKVAPKQIQDIIDVSKPYDSESATVMAECIGRNENISKEYQDAFLNVLSLYCDKKRPGSIGKYEISATKAPAQMRLMPDEIVNSSEKVCEALDRAFFFFQTRCGIRRLSDLHYKLMLMVVAVIFINDDYFNNKEIHNKLEAWYWTGLFSGKFDSDQNKKFMNDLNELEAAAESIVNMKNPSLTCVSAYSSDVMNRDGFSDKKLLLLERASEKRFPKENIRKFLCQYMLAKTYKGLTNLYPDVLSVYYDKESLQEHHVIPLGSATNVGESTRNLRGKKDFILNSPLNFVLICKSENKAIDALQPDIYMKDVEPKTKSTLMFNGSFPSAKKLCGNATAAKKVLEERYDDIKKDIETTIATLLR